MDSGRLSCRIDPDVPRGLVDPAGSAMTVNESTADLIRELTETLRDSKAFVVEQAPGVVQDLIRWEIARSTMGVVAGLVVAVLAVWLVRLARRLDPLDVTNDLAWIGAGIAGFVALPLMWCSAGDLVRVLVAPKAFLLEYLRQAVR